MYSLEFNIALSTDLEEIQEWQLPSLLAPPLLQSSAITANSADLVVTPLAQSKLNEMNTVIRNKTLP